MRGLGIAALAVAAGLVVACYDLSALTSGHGADLGATDLASDLSASMTDMALGDSAMGSYCKPGGTDDSCANIPGAILCETFENPDFSGFYRCTGQNFMCGAPAPETVVEQWTAAPQCNGTGVLHTHTAAIDRLSAYLGRFDTNGLPVEFYVRVLFYRPSGSQDGPFLSLLSDPIADAGAQILGRIDVSSAPNAIIVNGTPFPSSSVTRDAWHCAELHVRAANSSSGTIDVSIDGVGLGNIPGANIDPGWHFTTVIVGIPASRPDGSTDVFLDSLAVATSPIGCPAGL